MCGRFTLTLEPAALQAAFPPFSLPAQGQPRFNIAPTQPVLAVPNDGKFSARYFVWGLIPSWAKDASGGSRLINARAETLAEKPSFRGAFQYKRCLIFADGFYEWKANPGTKSKTPYFIGLKSGRPFALAGLWDTWHDPNGSSVNSCTIITTGPNELTAALHNRMPVILPPEAYQPWLDPAPQKPAALQKWLTSYPASEMTAYPVSTLVNNPANDQAALVIPV